MEYGKFISTVFHLYRCHRACCLILFHFSSLSGGIKYLLTTHFVLTVALMFAFRYVISLQFSYAHQYEHLSNVNTLRAV